MVLLAVWGALLGLIFGALMNVWFWPYMLGAGQEMYWQPGLKVWETLGRYAVFYLATSLWWDGDGLAGIFCSLFSWGPPCCAY